LSRIVVRTRFFVAAPDLQQGRSVDGHLDLFTPYVEQLYLDYLIIE
jgi:hypothetical protein